MNRDRHEREAQLLYARWLDAATRIAFALSAAAFIVYAGRLLPAQVPLDSLPALWGLPVDEYLRRTGAPSGWAWLGLVTRADYLSLACVALLPLVTMLCYLRILPPLLARRERLLAAAAAVQLAVLAAAASGFFSGG